MFSLSASAKKKCDKPFLAQELHTLPEISSSIKLVNEANLNAVEVAQSNQQQASNKRAQRCTASDNLIFLLRMQLIRRYLHTHTHIARSNWPNEPQKRVAEATANEF